MASQEARKTQYGLRCAVRTVTKEAKDVLPDTHRARLHSKSAKAARQHQAGYFRRAARFCLGSGDDSTSENRSRRMMEKELPVAEPIRKAGKRAPHSMEFKRHSLRPLLRYLAALASGG